jgi:hypothetical protein
MTETFRLGLPLVQASQAQKHVTVNEALSRLDAVTQLVLASRTLTTPPISAPEGTCYAVPNSAVNAWDGEDGNLAFFSNGGWQFLSPATGWTAWVADEGLGATYVAGDWVAGAASVTTHGAGLRQSTSEVDHAVAAGAVSLTAPIIPAGAIVYGVTGRVLSDITGTATGWQLGIDGVSANRYGSSLGLATGSWVRGLTSSPLTYYTATELALTAEGGSFAGGSVVWRFTTQN